MKLILLENRDTSFQFSPLQGDKAKELFSEEKRKCLPDSIVLYDNKNNIVTKSSAVIRILKMLGGTWTILGTLLLFIPRIFRDFTYDSIAKIRHKLFSNEKKCARQSQAICEINF